MLAIEIRSSGWSSRAVSSRAGATAWVGKPCLRPAARGNRSGEVSDLAGHASLAMVCAGPDGCTAYPFDLPHLRALLISSADIGEVMMRAFILRRAALLEGDNVGSVILGDAGSPETVRLRGLLTRNSYPHSLINVDGAEGGLSLSVSGYCPPISRS